MPKNNVLPKGELFTTIPDHFLSHIMTELSASELRVMLYIYLHTLGYGKLADKISYDQFLSGIVTHDGRRLDQGAGVSRRSLIGALSSLEKRGLITRHSNGYAAATIRIELFSTSNSNPALTDCETRDKAFDKSDEADTNKVKEDHLMSSSFSSTTAEVVAPSAEDTRPLFSTTITAAPQNGPVELEEMQGLQPRTNPAATQVQNLHEPQQNQVQNLHPTRDEFSFKHEDINRVQFAPITAEFFSAIKIITDKVADISEQEARRLVATAYQKHGRDEAYVQRLVTYVITNPTIQIPAAVLTTLINQNQDRSVCDESPQPKKRSNPYLRKRKEDTTISTLPYTDQDYCDQSQSTEHYTFSPNLVLSSGVVADYSNIASLLVQKHLVRNTSKAAYLIQLAQKNNIKPADVRIMITQALAASPGQRSASFEAIFNRAIAQFSLKTYRPGLHGLTNDKSVDFKSYSLAGN
jgi:hypothetical protein